MARRSLKSAFTMCLYTVFSFIFIGQIAANEASLLYTVEQSPPLDSHQFYDIRLDLLHGSLERFRRQVDPELAPAVSNTSDTLPANGTVDNDTMSQNVTIAPVPTVKVTPAPTTRAPVPTAASNLTTSKPVPTKTPTPTNSFTIKEDDRTYYKQKTIQQDTTHEPHWQWVDMQENGVRHLTLSEGYRLAQTVKLNFDFQFYGHTVTNVTIATGGFLYMSPFLHKLLTATQYIAPLMANFDTSLGNESFISYKSTSEIFVVQWENVHLKDQETAGRFNFQVHLKKQGEIRFLYKDVPVRISKIINKNHPVKIGLSDAFYIDKDVPELGMKRRTIFEYHRVAVSLEQIKQYTVILLIPQNTCNTARSCDSCLALDRTPDKSLGCSWCGVVSRCSDGIDWYRQDWLNQGCKYLSGNDNCSTIVDHHPPTQSPRTKKAGGSGGINAGWVIVIIAVITILLGVGGWFFYAYTHPTTASGMWLMEHRPTAMKTKLAKMKFWKQSTPAGEKYAVESEA